MAFTYAQSLSVPTWVGVSRPSKSPWANWPEKLAPQLHMVPSLFRASVCELPMVTITQSESSLSLVGVMSDAVPPPVPSCPLELFPQPHMVPSAFSPMAVYPQKWDTATSVQSLSVPTCTGSRWAMPSPVPCTPSVSEPTAHRVPSSLIKKAYALPPTTFAQSLSVPTHWKVAVRSLTVGTPNCPFSFQPQLHRVPSSRMA